MGNSNLTVVNANVYPYQNELIVELTARDSDGDLVVLSYQFEYADSNGGVVPKQAVDDEVAELVGEALVKEDYNWL